MKVYFDYCLVHLIRNELLLCNLMQRKMEKLEKLDNMRRNSLAGLMQRLNLLLVELV